MYGADTYDKTCDNITCDGTNTKTKMLASHIGVQISHVIYVMLLPGFAIDATEAKGQLDNFLCLENIWRSGSENCCSLLSQAAAMK